MYWTEWKDSIFPQDTLLYGESHWKKYSKIMQLLSAYTEGMVLYQRLGITKLCHKGSSRKFKRLPIWLKTDARIIMSLAWKVLSMFIP